MAACWDTLIHAAELIPVYRSEGGIRKRPIWIKSEKAKPAWWYDIVDGLPNPIVKNGLIDVWDRPGLGVALNAAKAQPYLSPDDSDFFE